MTSNVAQKYTDATVSGVVETRTTDGMRTSPVPEVGSKHFAEACQLLDTRSWRYKACKRLTDLIVALLAIIIGIIPGIVLSIIIAVDTKGSPIYSQERIGKRGKPFRIYKFRTMVADSDNVEKYFTPEELAQWKRERKVVDDVRITKFGRTLRKTSLDEFPQFINVLLGQIAIVGPRAITRDELEENFTPKEQEILLSVDPGITGLWQSGLRNEADWTNGLRQEIELRYVAQASFSFDVKLCLRTFKTILAKTGK